jgi:hypothetical protein
MALITVSCHRNPLKIDVSDIDINLNIKRLDLDLFKITPDNSKVKIPELQKEYGKFFDAYNENIIGLGNPSDSLYPTYLNSFLTDSMRIQSVLKIDSVFNDLTVIRKKLEDGFKHYRYYFPQNTVPQIITILSGFNQSVALNNEAIGISLDNYLGSDCTFYTMLGVAKYKKENMHSGKIPFDVLYSWAISEFEFDDSKTTLIANMIYYGKMLYFLDAMFPDEPDHLKIGYQPEKLEWCIRNEPGMWTYLIEHKLLFNSERMNIVRFIGAAPFTSTFTNESPGRTGIWLGWQIVRQYMKKNPNVTLPSLMTENDDQKILNDSGYSPGY